MKLSGKVAIITGGTSGLGRRMVERFIEEGARVIFSGRRAELGAEVSKATGATFVQADVAVEDDAARIIGNAIGTFGRVDVLVNNAGGVAIGGRIESVPLDNFDRTIAVHVRGAFAHMKHVSSVMRSQRSGRRSSQFQLDLFDGWQQPRIKLAIPEPFPNVLFGWLCALIH